MAVATLRHEDACIIRPTPVSFLSPVMVKNGIGVMMHESAYTINSFEQSYLPEKLCVKS